MLSISSRSYQEKRNYIRMKINAPVRLTLAADGRTLKGLCRDLSGGGLLVELNTVLPVGTRAEVMIASSHGHSPMLNAVAEVTRVNAKPEKDDTECILGLQIIEVLNS